MVGGTFFLYSRGNRPSFFQIKGLQERRSGSATLTPKKKQQMETPGTEQQQQQLQRIKNNGHAHRESSGSDDRDEDEMSKSALTAFRAKEEEIERKKMEVREKVFTQLGRVEQETKRLAAIRGELEALADPTRKEVAAIRKRIDGVNRELKPLGQSCLKKEKEYKEALEAFNEKNREKAQLLGKLMELVSESERMRMKKLEELSKTVDSLH